MAANAFNMGLSDHVSPSREAANTLLMEDVCRMMTSCLFHKILYLKEPQSYRTWRLFNLREMIANRQDRY